MSILEKLALGASLSSVEHCAPPHFLVGRNSQGEWVVRDRQAHCGGLFNSREAALRFAFRERGDTAGAVVLVPEPLELFEVSSDGASPGGASPGRPRPPTQPGGSLVMSRLCAQGDILIERVDKISLKARMLHSVSDGSVVIAQGEATGHHHRMFGSVTMYRDDALARDIPSGLYVGHVEVTSPTARLEHEEHAPITLAQGIYRVRRQRQLEPTDVGIQGHFSTLED